MHWSSLKTKTQAKGPGFLIELYKKVVFNAKDTRPVMKDAILHAVEFEYLWLVSKRRYYGNVHAEDEKRIPMIEDRMKAENHPLPTF